MTTTTDIQQLSGAELDALITRVTEASEHGLALTAEDTQLFVSALVTLASVQSQLNDKDITLTKLRKLLGMVQSSERLQNLVGGTSRPSKPKRPSRKTPATPPVKPKVEHHHHTELSKGDVCPECDQGKLAKAPPASLLRITGKSSFMPVQHVAERLRCNTCGASFTATLSEDVLADGDVNQKYGYSARSVMALHKYFSTLPVHLFLVRAACNNCSAYPSAPPPCMTNVSPSRMICTPYLSNQTLGG